LLKENSITQSMSRKGNCWDDAVAESFFKSLKNKLVYQTIFYTKKQAKQKVFKYIELFYNRVRSYSYLNGLSSVEFEEKIEMLRAETAA
jgi:transposase InsO family protein